MRSFISNPLDGLPPAEADKRRRVAQALMASPPTDVGSGLAAIGQAIGSRKPRGPFPDAPGGNTMQTMLRGLFSLGRGGLY